MKRRLPARIALLVGAGLPLLAGPLRVDREGFVGGGGTASTAGYSLAGTIGQPVGESMSANAGPAKSTSGFWSQMMLAAPVSGADVVHRPTGRSIKIAVANLLANDMGVPGLYLRVTTVAAVSAGGVPLQLLNGVVFYTPAAGFDADDTFNYTLSDGFQPVSGTVTVIVDAAPTSPTQNLTGTRLTGPPGAEQLQIGAAGIPGRRYRLQSTASVVPPIVWTDLGGTQIAPSTGQMDFSDPVPASPRFYRIIPAIGP